MKKKWLFIVLAVLIVICSIIILKGRKEYVVLISLDGFRWDYEQIYDTPGLDAIADKGVRAKSLISAFPTKTFPNHYSIATGLYPDHHGLVNNTFYAPELEMLYRIGNREMVENGDFYDGEPIWSTAARDGLKTASMFWVGTEASINGIQPDFWSSYDGSLDYGSRVDSVIHWLSLPRSERPEFITLYFDEPDATSHDFGPLSFETDSVVNYLDNKIIELSDRINSLPHGKRINLIIVSDHGMGEISNERVLNLKKIIPEEYIEYYYGGNPVILIDPAETCKDSILAILNRTEGVKGWDKENMPAEYHYGTNPRIPPIIAEADSAWSIVWSSRDDYYLRGKGAHGYDPGNTDMHGIFYASGPSFKKGIIHPSFENINIYNLICEILNIEPADNDGDIDLVKDMLK